MGSGEEVLAVEIGHRLRNGKGKLAMGTAISDLMEYSQRSSSIAPISLFFSTLKVPALRQAENKETIPEYAPQLKLIGSFKVDLIGTIICTIILPIKSFFARNLD